MKMIQLVSVCIIVLMFCGAAYKSARLGTNLFENTFEQAITAKSAAYESNFERSSFCDQARIGKASFQIEGIRINDFVTVAIICDAKGRIPVLSKKELDYAVAWVSWRLSEHNVAVLEDRQEEDIKSSSGETVTEKGAGLNGS
ncbi:MAG: hypothetical protein Aurels2KO_30670 [Aureliella sp.]